MSGWNDLLGSVGDPDATSPTLRSYHSTLTTVRSDNGVHQALVYRGFPSLQEQGGVVHRFSQSTD